MGRFPFGRALALVLVLFVSPARAEECGWLPASALDRAFPDGAPWSTMVGGKVGSCKFRSDPTRAPNIFGANQMVKESEKEAAAFVAELRPSMAESYDVEPAPAIGAKGFVYRPRESGPDAGRSLFFVGHRGRVAVMGSMSFQKPITAEERKAAEVLLLAALEMDEEAMEAATNCKWFDRALVRKLLPEEGYSEQVFGERSCLATAGEKVVMLSITETENAALISQRMIEMGGCTTEPIELAEAAWLQHGCTSGNPRASVRWVSGARMFELSFVPGKEPTEKERGILVDLAKVAASR